MSDNRDIGYAALGFGFGIWSFFWGFTRLRRKRLIENIPTSTVRGMAMGLVELVGKAQRTKNLKGPLSAEDCVAYRYTIERYEQSSKSGRWVTIAQGDSFYCPFWIEDQTGKVLVCAQGAELIFSLNYEFKTGWGKELPVNLIDFMEKNNLKYKGFLTHYSLRFREWDIFPGQNIYVLGSAKKKQYDWVEHNEKLGQRLEELKSNQAKMLEIDEDKDGQISSQEWSRAVDTIEQQLLEGQVNAGPLDEQADVIIGRGEEEKAFIISDESQKELTQKLTLQVAAGVFGGAALTLAALGYLLFRLGFLGMG